MDGGQKKSGLRAEKSQRRLHGKEGEKRKKGKEYGREKKDMLERRDKLEKKKRYRLVECTRLGVRRAGFYTPLCHCLSVGHCLSRYLSLLLLMLLVLVCQLFRTGPCVFCPPPSTTATGPEAQRGATSNK